MAKIKVAHMGSDRGDDDNNVVSIFDRVSHRASRYRSILESDDPEFQRLVEVYLSNVGSQSPDNARSKNDVGLAIMRYETSDQMDLLIKFAILETALGYGASSGHHHMVHETLMCHYFKKSMIEFMENRLNIAE